MQAEVTRFDSGNNVTPMKSCLQTLMTRRLTLVAGEYNDGKPGYHEFLAKFNWHVRDLEMEQPIPRLVRHVLMTTPLTDKQGFYQLQDHKDDVDFSVKLKERKASITSTALVPHILEKHLMKC